MWAAASGAQAADETITVPGGVGGGAVVTTSTVLVAADTYQITATGTVSYWCESSDPTTCLWPDVPSHPNVEEAGVDALYCYATWRCPTTQLWRPLQVNGVGLDQFAGQDGKIPYDGSHTYTVTVTGVSGALSLQDTASTQISSLQVTIRDLSRGSGNAPSLTVAPPASAWGQSTAPTTVAPGSGVVVVSPVLGRAQRQATVRVPRDQNTAMTFVANNGPQKPGDCVYVALAVIKPYRDTIDNELKFSFPPEVITLVFEKAMLDCLDLVRQIQGEAGPAGAAPCHTTAVRITHTSHRGRRHRLATPDSQPPLVFSCKRSPAGLIVHVATRSRHQALRAVLGPRLLVGLSRSSRAGGTASVRATFEAG
jgi:hypothetical protein